MNKIFISGRLTKDPEVSETKNGTEKAEFTVAVKNDYKSVDGEYETTFFPCCAWRNTATAMQKYCKKGDMVFVEGDMREYRYEKDGENRSYWHLNATKVDFVGTKTEEEHKIHRVRARQEQMEEINDTSLPF